MGLLDGLLGGLMGGGMGNNTPAQQGGGLGGLGGLGGSGGAGGMSGMGGVGTAAIIGIVLQLLQRNGGIGGLMQQMQQAGYGSQAQSWIGTGQNQHVSPDVLSQILGSGQMQDIASQLGMSHDQAASSLAQALPHVVDQMTPSGAIPHDSDDLVSRTLQELMQGR